MKLAISNIAWLPGEDDAVAHILKGLSIRGVELAPTLLFANPVDSSDADIASVRRYWSDNGIDIVALQSLLFGHPEFQLFDGAGERRAMSDYLKKIIKLGGKLGAGVLVFGSPKNRVRGAMTAMAARQIAVDFFTELAAVASDHGTCLCVEANAPEYGCDFVTNLREAVDLVTCVGCSGFGLHVDAGVMTMNGEGGDELFHAVLPHMRHFHISEPFLGTITAGQTDHPLLGRRLREAGFAGWKSIEMRSGLGESNPRMVEECLRYAVACYG